MHTVEHYLRELGTVYAAGGVAETSGYPPLLALLNAAGESLAPRVLAVAHPASIGAGIPDLALYTSDQFARDGAPRPGLLPGRGVVEVKGVNADLRSLAASAQVQRYLDAYGLVLVTNYLSFGLVTAGTNGVAQLGETFALAANAASFRSADPQTLALQRGDDLLSFLRRALLLRAPLRTPKDLATTLAAYAREASALIERQRQLPALDGLRRSLEQALGITFEGERGDHFFRSTLVQTLFYGVFSGWVLWHAEQPDRNDRFSWRLAASYLHLPILQSLFGQLVQASRLRALGLIDVLGWTDDALNRVERGAFFTAFAEDEAVQYFYEPFLAAFDPELRRDLGVWYTPREIVRYQVARVDQALREELGITSGLADKRVYILDPCCGTGAYIVEVIASIAATLRAQGDDDLLASDLKTALTERVFGFELLPAPFVVAHLQLGLLLQRFGATLAGDERAAVFLTNALTGWEPPTGPRAQLMFPELEAEREAASKIKRETKILVILGNPPYSGYAGIGIGEERTLSNAYRTTRAAPTPQGQGLNDLYIRFFRMAERQIVEQSQYGIVSFISNYSWLDGLSFTGMRERYLEVFDQIWVDNLNGDKYKTGKLTPEGAPDPSVFSTEFNREGIQVGTAIATLVRRPQAHEGATVQFRQFWGRAKRDALLASLHAPDAQPYQTLAPALPLGLPFVPAHTNADYLTWPLLPELFPTSFPGVKTSRDDVVVDIDRERLERRMRAYFDLSISHEEMRRIAPGAMDDTARFDAVSVRDTLRQRGFLAENIVRYCYRPFDIRWLYWEPETKLLDEKRTEYKSQVEPGNLFLFTTGHTRKDTIEPALSVSLLVDLNCMDSGARGFPLYVNDARTSLFDYEQTGMHTVNLSEQAKRYLAQVQCEPVDLFLHALATIHSQTYRVDNQAALRADWPRIPLPASGAALRASAALGQRIAALLDPEAPVIGVTNRQLQPELLTLGRLRRTAGSAVQPEAGDLALTAGWGHAGRGGIVMPARGRVTERAFTPEEATALGAAATLLGGRTCDIWLNDQAGWHNLPLAVWEYTIGGYQVIKKWLSYRERPLLGRDLTPDEARYVTSVVRRIAALILLGPALDLHYQAGALAEAE